MDFSTDQGLANGTGKPIPYRVQAELLHQFSTISRDAKRYGLFRSLDTGQAQKTYTYILKAPLKKTTPQSASLTAPLTQGAKGCGTNLYLAYVKRQLSGFVGNFDTGLTQ